MYLPNAFKHVPLYLALVVVLMNNNIKVRGSPTGAPLVACQDMTPQHVGSDPQTTSSLFSTIPASTLITRGSTLRLTLTSNSTQELFKGFLIMGFNNASVAAGPIGSFSAVSDGKLIDCLRITQSAATHQNNNNKTSVTVDWVAPQGFVGTVLFQTTYVQEYSVYWVQTVAPLVTVV